MWLTTTKNVLLQSILLKFRTRCFRSSSPQFMHKPITTRVWSRLYSKGLISFFEEPREHVPALVLTVAETAIFNFAAFGNTSFSLSGRYKGGASSAIGL